MKFNITFERQLDVTVEAESLEAAQKAANETAKRNLKGWDVDPWDVSVSPVRPEWADKVEAECGVWGGEILEMSDYLRAKRQHEENHGPQSTPEPIDLRTPCLFCNKRPCEHRP